MKNDVERSFVFLSDWLLVPGLELIESTFHRSGNNQCVWVECVNRSVTPPHQVNAGSLEAEWLRSERVLCECESSCHSSLCVSVVRFIMPSAVQTESRK